jgi:acyl-CoA synthetase (AMP-forming)/AMP-acid ligase II
MPSLPLDTRDFVQLLKARAEGNPEGLAFGMANESADAETRVTYAELDALARRVAVALADRGLAGERVLLLLNPGEHYIAGFVGCWYAGATAVPVYAPRQNASFERIRLIAEDCRAAAILSTSQILATFDAGFAPSVPRLAIDTMVQPGAESLWRMPDIDADTLAVLQYTSGSTGHPKGVRLCHRHLIENSRIILSAMRSTPESVCIIWVPPYHDMGLIGGLLQPLYGGFPVHLMSPAAFLQRPMRWLESISRHRGTISAAPNFAFDLCVRRAKPEQIERLDLSSWRVAANGAEPIRAETLRRFAETFAPAGFDRRAFFPCFGMAETTLLVSGAGYFEGAVASSFDRSGLSAGRLVPAGEAGVELVSSGRTAAGVDLAIVDPVLRRRCEAGEVGEVWVSGATVADGYWQQPEVNRETFGATLPGSDAAWLCTGDLGALSDGELYVTGRIKDLIVIHGHNHYPQDIEATALAAHPALRPQGAAAFAIDGPAGEELGLVLELERGQQNGHLEAIRVAVVEAISQEQQLHVGQLAFVKANTIPKTSSGKVQRRATRERLLAGGFEVLGAEVPV